MKTTFLYFLILISLISCKKEINEIPESNQPIYFIEGEIDGENVFFEVDDELVTFQSSTEIINGVDFFKGNITSNDIDLEIGLFDGNIDKTSSLTEILSNIQSINFSDFKEMDLLNLNKYLFINPEVISKIEWFVNGNFHSLNTLKITEPGKYELCAKCYFTDQTIETICNDVILGYKKNTKFSLDYKIDENKTLNASINSYGESIETINWYIDDVFYSSDLILTNKIDQKVHKIKALINFKNGVSRTRTILVDGNENKHSMLDFGFFENENKYSNDFKLKMNLKIGGIQYFSNLIDNNSNHFELSEISFIGVDENSYKHYVLKGNLNANLFASQTSEIKNVNLSISWGIVLK
jgi:hypothetical protein